MSQNRDLTDSKEEKDTTPTIRSGGSESSKKSASIGPSITIHGDVTGEEDLVVAGTIEGTVNLKDNNLVIDENGHVMANVTARVIRVDGEVKGELRASEKVVIKPSGHVNGDIRAPRVVLEDGCHFKGSVDMEGDKATLTSDRGHPPRLRPSSPRPVRPGREKVESTDKLAN
ncbi:MAG: cytoskeletal protein CcmA (bactofilin family) [Gammaproteobacteria bacterium]|jgi:cytoskeletal protein CcmA (bactofilin family)